MNNANSFASLSPTLLARKGAARPAMRPQVQPLHTFHEATARQMYDDLGWNDMGHDVHDCSADLSPQAGSAEIVPIAGDAEIALVASRDRKVVSKLAVLSENLETPPKMRQSALTEGRRTAFTLRLDAERHLRLRLACTIKNRSAQQMLSEALDSLLNEIRGLGNLADRIKQR